MRTDSTAWSRSSEDSDGKLRFFSVFFYARNEHLQITMKDLKAVPSSAEDGFEPASLYRIGVSGLRLWSYLAKK